MKQIEQINEVRQFFLYRGLPVLAFKDKLHVGKVVLDAAESDDYFVEKNVLTKDVREGKETKLYLYTDGHFENNSIQPKYGSRNVYFSSDEYCCFEYDDASNVEKVCFSDYEKEYCFSVETQDRFYLPSYNRGTSILVFPLWDDKTLLFYTKKGEKLWGYKEEDERLEVSGSCIPIVDDVVVIISQKIVATQKIQGFDIHTGAKLWELNDGGAYPNTFFMGEDKMLYGCMSIWNEGYDSSKIQMCKLNPFTGEVEITVLRDGDIYEVLPWLVTMHGRRLYYADNRSGGEIGIIDIDKKELLDCTPLNLKGRCPIGAPVVTDDKVYQFIREMRELRVYENIPI